MLRKIAVALRDSVLEAVLIGNAAAALQGALVTTQDFDSLFRAAPANLRKLKSLARRLGATIRRPYYPVSSLYRVVNDDTGMQGDFMTTIHAVKSLLLKRPMAERTHFLRVRLPSGGSAL